MTNWKTGDVAAVKVIKHLPGGLLVRLPDGQTGMIRTRETAWDAHQRLNWQQAFPQGWQSDAVVIKTGGKYVELSLRFLEKDPWQELETRFRPGAAVEGVVTGAKHYGIFVEILPGISGLLRAAQLPAWCKKDPTDLFWPGDKVRVTIQKIDHEQKQVELDLAPANLATLGSRVISARPIASAAAQSTPARLPFDLLAAQPRRSILVIEDDIDQGEAAVTWFKNLNQRVAWAQTGEDGLEQVLKDPPDLAFVDLRLPGINGIETIRQIRAAHPQVTCILNTDWTMDEADLSEMDELHNAGVGLLFKPLLPEDLLDILLDGQKNAVPEMADAPGRLSTGFELTDLNAINDRSAIKKLVERCRRTTEFDVAVLFSIHPAERKVNITVQRGGRYDPNLVLDDLIYSPVRDVAEDGDLVQVEDAASGPYHDRFRYLLKAFPFAACLGVKIPGQLPADYALFLFSHEARTLYDEEVVFAQATALAIGAILEKKVLLDQVTASQKMVVMGHLARNVIHEINNNLSLVNLSVDNLAQKWAALIGDEPQVKIPQAEVQATRALIDLLQQSMHNLANTAHIARGVISLSGESIIRLDEMVEQIHYLLRETIRKSRVTIHVDAGKSLLLIRGQMPPLQQVLLNLLLNATEQIAELRPQQGGQVLVGFERVERAEGPPLLRILIHDDGPGIHHRLWEKVFEAGFSTRKDGSGLGLYISRYIISTMGGKIYVADSNILQGSTFAVELPFQF
jgi:signal transduction histidine kinase/predicted RNA-binding protein with RPS1 domain/FixJ family two-component response regulator